jgi:hypothetical protein
MPKPDAYRISNIDRDFICKVGFSTWIHLSCKQCYLRCHLVPFMQAIREEHRIDGRTLYNLRKLKFEVGKHV